MALKYRYTQSTIENGDIQFSFCRLSDGGNDAEGLIEFIQYFLINPDDWYKFIDITEVCEPKQLLWQ